MADEISYFEVASYLAEIESEYAEISDPIERTQQLVARLQEKWPALTASQAVAYVRVTPPCYNPSRRQPIRHSYSSAPPTPQEAR